ncbi:hypothetical protein D3C71_2100570 [compost metagenome]
MLGSDHPAVIQQPAAQNILADIRLQRQGLNTLQLTEHPAAFKNGCDQRSAHAGDCDTVRFTGFQHFQAITSADGYSCA